jgi:molybdate transport system substrate-binding protein
MSDHHRTTERRIARTLATALALAGLATAVLLTGCAPQKAAPVAAEAEPVELSVSAATTLKAAFTELAPEFEKANNAKLVLDYGASGVLQKQIEGGAPCDVFASASAVQIDSLVAQGLISADSTETFASNDLVIIVPTSNPAAVSAPADLAKATKLVTGNPETAAHGTKAKEFLTGLGTWEGLAPKFVFAENAAQTVDYIARGEVDAGLVFASEVTGNDSVKVVYTVPKGAIRPVRYVAAPIKATVESGLAEKFVAFLLTPGAQRVLAANGFKSAPAK